MSIIFTIKVTQLFSRILFAFQVHDGNDHAQYDDQGCQQHNDPSFTIGRRRIRSGWVRRIHNDRHWSAIGSIPTSSVRLDSGRETSAHRQVQ